MFIYTENLLYIPCQCIYLLFNIIIKVDDLDDIDNCTFNIIWIFLIYVFVYFRLEQETYIAL